MSLTTVDPSGGLTRDNLRSLLAAVCAGTGLDPAHAELIKFTNNAVFRLVADPVVVRIAGSTATRERVETVVRVARWLERHRFPAVRLLAGVEQPIRLDGQVITLWERVQDVGPRPDGAQLAGLLRRLHRLPPPPGGLPPWSPMDEVRRRLAEPEELSAEDHAFLLRECDEVEASLAGLRFVLPPGVIHGDAFLGNLIAGRRGPVLCDFDGTSVGPREWDLTPVAVGRLRLDYPGDDHAPLARRYGLDVMHWEGFPVLRRLRELKLVTSVLPILRSNPAVRAQWEHRMRTYKAGDLTTRWQPYR
ncbi:aminoglycoside phosphotransferase [Sphaerisporangium krabiense]|uniref:Aminoglycoside phosphotransferase (APT) family kinase protein n=1 Tax=Sphaerisporangium krabiense TaxID=763782 RepID=A0A7W8Z8Y3_9ACTN|nr:aminoglycoside phosphotransferase family protein [Sphaerisporangium krabiense]MBB5629656.1 aminoglycoside phosphotransferase (APT) family kinase protein [Sphaerisporangium krabiense]GII63754.1 aminoglycoside phosphotransferase [Sphaerisporangium krabiense]